MHTEVDPKTHSGQLLPSESGCHPPQLLPADLFASVVANAPLVAIDLIVQNSEQAVLLGMRNNPPAQGWWFVPGGRVRKNESLDAAFARIAQTEIGLDLSRSSSQLIGVYEHLYDTDFRNTPNSSTHYIVLAYRMPIARQSWPLPHDQHSQYAWVPPDRVTSMRRIHPYTMAYFEILKQ